ncbi:MAG: tetratricopeptide repeat protein [Planctomycetota bacterium]
MTMTHSTHRPQTQPRLPVSAFMHTRLWAAVLIALLAGLNCAAFDVPPDISKELADARAAWRSADEKTLAMRDGKYREPEELDKLIDARDKAHDDAIALFEKALKKDSKNPQALMEFGRYWFARRDFYIARSYLEEAWGVWQPPFWRDAGRFWNEAISGSTRLCERPFVSTTFTPERCSARTERSLSPADKADILRTLGGIAERSGENPSAIAFYREAMNRFPADPRNRVSLAVALCAIGNSNDAIAVLEPWDRVAELVPEPADFPKDRPDILALGLYTLALGKEQIGLLDDALKMYQRAEAATSKSFSAGGETSDGARMSIARLEDKLDEFADNEVANAKEVETYAKINEERRKAQMPPLTPPKPERVNYADALNFTWHATSAKSQAFRDPEFTTALSRLRYNEVKVKDVENTPGHALFQSAESSFQAGIASYSKYARPYYELALCELQLHRYTSARTLLDAAVLYSPNDITMLGLRGSVLLELGQWEEAAGVFRKVIQLDYDNGAAHFGLGRALTALKTNEAVCSEALDSFSRAARLGVRDERMDSARSLTTRDGQVYAGHLVRDGTDWIVMEEGAAPFRIASAEIAKVNDGPSLRQQASEMLVRYRNGEKPIRVIRLGGRKNFEESPAMPISPGGTIFGR